MPALQELDMLKLVLFQKALFQIISQIVLFTFLVE